MPGALEAIILHETFLYSIFTTEHLSRSRYMYLFIIFRIKEFISWNMFSVNNNIEQ